MSQLDKIGTYPFVAEPFHVDFTGHLTIGVLGNQLLNAAGFHSHDRGFEPGATYVGSLKVGIGDD